MRRRIELRDLMSNSILLDKSKAFALKVIRLCNEVKTGKRESVLTSRLVRSGIGAGANIAGRVIYH